MRCRWVLRITLLCAVLSCSLGAQTTPPPTNETLDQGTVQMLSNILESLDTFRNDRLRDLERITRIPSPDGGNATTTVARLDDLTRMPDNGSVSEHIKALKEGIMGHNPVKKTFGYKVTVYTSPIGRDGKDSKPVLVTQYVGGDMRPPTRRADDSEDLQESGNHPDSQQVHSSESLLLPIHSSNHHSSSLGDQSAVAKGAKDHSRNTEHVEASEKGHSNGHSSSAKVAKGHDHERHSSQHDEHTKETEKEGHRHDEQAHDRGGASQQGVRERTEIEYYEREHFLDTEYDKAKSGHDKTHGLKEHASHSDHDSHEDKKLHHKDDTHGHKDAHKEASEAQKARDIDSHYVPPLLTDHPHVVTKDLLHSDQLSLQEDAGHSKLHHSEESKGHREHNSEKDLQTEEKDQAYLDKDKGRRKEGYRERGYKITAEREYFLNDAHHDKGTASHTSGHKLKDQEGAAHSAKEGERDRGFVKESKDEEAHDAAYDAKEKKFYDGEGHSEGFESSKTASSGGEKKEAEEVIPLAPPIVNYVEPERHPSHFYPPPPLPIVYSSSDDGAQAVLAYPPADLPPPKTSNIHIPPAVYSITSNREQANAPSNQQPLGGYDDDDVNLQSNGYRGHASYKKRAPNPLVASIRENVRKDVHAKPPTYKTESENSSPSAENSVRFPDDSSEEGRKYQKTSSSEADEADLHREEPSRTYEESPKFEQGVRRRPESKEVYFQKDTSSQHGHKSPNVEYRPPKDSVNTREQYRLQKDLVNPHEQYRPQKDVDFEQERRRPDTKEVYFQKGHQDSNGDDQYRLIPTKKDVVYLEESKRKRPPHSEQVHNSHRPRDQSSRLLYVQGAQNADKLLRSADRSVYPHLQTHSPTVSDLIQEIVRYPQPQEVQHYPQRNTNDNTQLTYADLHQIYNPKPQQAYRTQKTPQQQLIAKYNHLLQNVQANGDDHRSDLLHLQQHPRTLDQLQQQTKPPFSPVVLLSRGPPSQKQNQAVDVWYTRPRS